MSDVGPNAEFITCWNDIMEPKFRGFQEMMLRGLALFSDAVVAEVASEGARVLDVGCGWGDTTIAIAKRVGPRGRALGIDCVPKFLAHGRALAAEQGLRNVELVEGDAQTYAFEPGWDVVFARFGTMFFASPVQALRNLGRACKPGARLAMIVWRRIEENDWLYQAKQIALRHLPAVEQPAATCGPGPFSMASQEVLAPILEAAGWRDAGWRPIDVVMRLGSVENALSVQTLLGPAGEIIREHGERGEAMRATIMADLTAWARGHVRDGEVEAGAASWCVTARWQG